MDNFPSFSSIQNLSIASIKNSLDEVRAQVYPRNETERKVYEALSSKNWGASTTLLNEISAETNDYEKYGIIMNLVWSSLDTDGRSWKQMFKVLTLIEYLIKNGSDRVIDACRDKLFRIRVLQDFTFFEGTADKGSGVREKAKIVVELLGNNELIRSERAKAKQLRNKFVGISNDGGSSGYGGGGSGYGDSYGDKYSSNSNNRDSNSYSGSGSGSGGGGGRYEDTPSGYSGGGIGGGGGSGGGSSSRYDDESSGTGHRAQEQSSEDFDDDASKAKSSYKPKLQMKVAGEGKSTSTGGKLKVSIKKAAAGKQQVAEPEIDLFNSNDNDFQSAPVSVPPSTNFFDDNNGFSQSFSTFQQAPPAPQQQSRAFDPFGSDSNVAFGQNQNFQQQQQQQFANQQFAQAQSVYNQPVAPFDPFAQPPVAPQPSYMQNQNQFGQMQMQMPSMQPQLQSFQQQQFQQQLQPQSQFQPQVQNTMLSPPPVPRLPPSAAVDQDFGDFESAAPTLTKQAQSSSTAKISDKWGGDLSKLVDLGGISKNEVVKPEVAKSSATQMHTQSSFAGLDGFSKSQMSMQASGSALRPGMGQSGGGGLPMAQAMRPAVPMGSGMGMGMNMGMVQAPMVMMSPPMNGGMQPGYSNGQNFEQQYTGQQMQGQGQYAQGQFAGGMAGPGMGYAPQFQPQQQQQQYAYNQQQQQGGFGRF